MQWVIAGRGVGVIANPGMKNSAAVNITVAK